MAEEKIVLVTGAGSGIGRAVAESAARAGHIVYAAMRAIRGRNRDRADALAKLAAAEGWRLFPIELDVLSDASCREAVDQVLLEQGRLDVLVNNAGMLMAGIAEAFTPEQMTKVLETNAVSWLRVNRAVLPVMRRQEKGLLVYIGSTTSRLNEPFIALYVASKAAGEALAESMSFELTPFGIETVIVVPGAFTSGTEHFNHANPPASEAVVQQYGDLPLLFATLGEKIAAIDAENGGGIGVNSVGAEVARTIGLPHGSRPLRLVVDPQEKGMAEINSVTQDKQRDFFRRLGIEHLMVVGRPR